MSQETDDTTSSDEDVDFLIRSPLLESRRLFVSTTEIQALVIKSLVEEGKIEDPEDMAEAYWIWTTEDGEPSVTLLFPGVEA